MLPSGPSIRLELANRIPVPDDQLFLAGPKLCFEFYEKPPFLANCHWTALVTAVLLFSLVTISGFSLQMRSILAVLLMQSSPWPQATSVLVIENKYTAVASRSPLISAIINNSNIQKADTMELLLTTFLLTLALVNPGATSPSPTPTQPPVTSCTVGNNAPCGTGSTCTPTMISTYGQPWLGQCIATPTPVTETPCVIGDNSPCGSGSTCTPTMTCTSGLPCSGACISAPATATTICTVGNNAPCSSGSTCTPTMVCTSGTPCGGACIATPTPVTETPCVIGDNSPCGAGSTCTPTMVCTTNLPCSGACISAPASTICTVGNDTPCSSGSTCTPTMTCTSGVPCGGACIATPTPPSSTATPTPSPCGGKDRPYCARGYKCVQAPGKDCGPEPRCLGICVPK
ncbi:uncharacterized protein K441DRAFT_62556 [Cenococcum geophilum 1.58]|uniref:uncharacterized protein n=1 Tax=Cenococcum geophilum 1.58 TaxID=794803 RepID=UPI00358EE568|nr:hypothetical protein K441DRAFT_62556 [Cenococcum geophilum 1.58]